MPSNDELIETGLRYYQQNKKTINKQHIAWCVLRYGYLIHPNVKELAYIIKRSLEKVVGTDQAEQMMRDPMVYQQKMETLLMSSTLVGVVGAVSDNLNALSFTMYYCVLGCIEWARQLDM